MPSCDFPRIGVSAGDSSPLAFCDDRGVLKTSSSYADVEDPEWLSISGWLLLPGEVKWGLRGVLRGV